MRSALLVRPLGSLGLLAALALWLDPRTVVAAVEGVAPGWVLLGLALTLPQVALCAWRWRLTARLLDLPLGWRRALHDYYLALFLNQVLPGGVMGDAARAWRHAGASGRRGGAWRAVVIERASGQLAMLLLTLAVLLASSLWHDVLWRVLQAVARPVVTASPGALGLGALAFVLGGGLAVAGARRLHRRPPRP
ncbi:lysylphosphatidylglycerol synthase domain-containing protein, partial [Halomonas sp. NO4]|uniref:lysylphosphatidylglycerol synthase domain-containing protein n=1 Tax=Halomonas sp. NO4 TaxID=2484813 RepID=UPI001969A8F3